MAEIPRSSFIPKQTPTAVPTRVKKKRRFSALTYTGNAILVISLLVAGGTFFYKDYVKSDLENTKAALEAERTRFNEAEIASLRELDYRFSVARLLLENHLAPSKIFDTLELTTKERVQFTDFAFTQQPSQNASLSIGGGTEEFKTVALQSLTFGSDPLLGDTIFTGITNQVPSIDNQGNVSQVDTGDVPDVTFSVEGSVLGENMLFDGSSLSAANEVEEEGESETIDESSDEESNEEETDSSENDEAEEGVDADSEVIEE